MRATYRWQKLCVFCVAVAALAACGTPMLYHDGYEDSLQRLYVKASAPEAEARLRQIILSPEATRRVPPGVHAEYGFLLFQRGDYAGAIENFEKERRAFPESATLMARLIERSRQQKTMPDTKKR